MNAVVLVFCVIAAQPDRAAAALDRSTLPAGDLPYAYYFTLSPSAPADREQVAAALKFVVPSLSHRAYLPDQLPVKVTDTLYRIDTRGLGWEHTLPKVLIEHYPYAPHVTKRGLAPLVVDARWFVAAVTDPVETKDAQYLLLYGRAPPDATTFRTFWSVQDKATLNFGRIEGKSGVSVDRTRLIENNASGNRGYHWQTFDSRVVAGQADPLENLLTRPPKHDASELIAAIPKYVGDEVGTLQAYLLTDGQGKRIEEADTKIVVDSTGVRGPAIKNTISCVACHVEGIRHPTLDQYREYILSGARIYVADKLDQQEIDRYYHSPLAKEIRRNNEDYAAGVKLCNGLSPEENAKGFIRVVQQYDAEVTLDQAAAELGADGRTLQLALADYSRRYGLTGRLALLSMDKPISRRQWAETYERAYYILSVWSDDQ